MSLPTLPRGNGNGLSPTDFPQGQVPSTDRPPAVAAPASDCTPMAPMLLPSLTNFILTFFSIFLPPEIFQPTFPPHNTLNFRLRHFHAVTPSAHVYFADVPLYSSSSLYDDSQPLSIPIAPVRTARPPSEAAFTEARALSMRGQSTTLHWEEDEIPGPDVSKRETLLLLAKMTSNAYIEPNTDGWYNLTDEWGIVRSLVFSESRLCGLTQAPDVRSTNRLGGNQITTGLGGTSSRRTTTALSSFRSKARPHSGLTRGRPREKIRRTITCCSAAVAHVSTGRGQQCATATEAAGNVIRTALKTPLSKKAYFTLSEP